MNRRTSKIVNLVLETKFQDLPSEVVRKTKEHILDSIGVALASLVENRQLEAKLLLHTEGGKHRSSSVIGTESLYSAESATLVNSFLAHSIEMDDEHRKSMAHIGAAIVPSAIAFGEEVRASGRDLILAIVLGYEIAARLGEALRPLAVYQRGFHPSCISVTFGAAASSLSLVKDCSNKMAENSFGLAAVQCAGIMAGVDKGPTSWYFQYAKAAQSGVISTNLALDGLSGPQDIFDEDHTFFETFSASPEPDLLVDDHGTRYKISEAGFKPYPCCRSIHPGLDSLRHLLETQSLQVNEIERIDFLVPPSVLHLVSNQNFRENRLSAQTSSEYCFALQVLRGHVLPDDFAEDSLHDEKLAKFASKVRALGDESLEKLMPEKMPGIVQIYALGNKFESRSDYPSGDPENPISHHELIEKFRKINSRNLGKSRQDQVIAAIENLEKAESLDELGALLRG